MNGKKVIVGGLAAGVVFYAISLIIWGLFKFLPVVPLPVVIQQQGLQQGWLIEHLLVSLFIGLIWSFGYAVHSRARLSGWLFGAMVYVIGLLPVFVTQFIIFAPVRALTVYVAIISLVGALLGGKIISLIAKK